MRTLSKSAYVCLSLSSGASCSCYPTLGDLYEGSAGTSTTAAEVSTTSTTSPPTTTTTSPSSASTATNDVTASETTTPRPTTGEPTCGDGAVDPGEVCDDGVNDASYNGCLPDCTALAAFCGDGKIDDGYELCDDGNQIDSDACSNACGIENCREVMVSLEPLRPKIVLVIDKSGSMFVNEWDHDGDPDTPTVTRWFSIFGALDLILTEFQHHTDLGLVLFPSKEAKSEYNANACIVGNYPDVQCATGNKDAILSAIPPANSYFGGATPASAGMLVALSHLTNFDQKFSRSVIFITDGPANCSSWATKDFDRFEIYDDSLHTLISSALQSYHIYTYVVGVDISMTSTGPAQDGQPDNVVPFQKLNELAVAGGKPKDDFFELFHATTNQIELKSALYAIVNDNISCVVALDEPPVFPQNTRVFLGDDLVPNVADCAKKDGWVFVDDPPTEIALCGTWCDQFKTAQMLDVELHCTPR